jgi:hypothetical protein
MRQTFLMRVACSLKALGILWLVSGVVFTIIVRGIGVIEAWCIWGTGVFAIGWIVVGLPLISLGERVRRIPCLLLAVMGGLGGALVIDLPGIFVLLIDPRENHANFTSFSALKWEGIAFTIAAPATVLYQLFLDRALQNH